MDLQGQAAEDRGQHLKWNTNWFRHKKQMVSVRRNNSWCRKVGYA